MEHRKSLDITKKNTALLGLDFVILLGLTYAENLFFFNIMTAVLQNKLLAIAMLFLHNVLVVFLFIIV